MAKVVIFLLKNNPKEEFIYNLTPEETNTIFGGFYPYGFFINNITDAVTINAPGGDNTTEAGINSISIHDNKIHTLDNSRSIYNRFV